MARLLEALEAGDWDAGGGDADLDADLEELGLGNDDEEDGIVGGDGNESDMRQPIIMPLGTDRDLGETMGDDEDENDTEVEELHRMMLKMQAVKGMFSLTSPCTTGRSEKRIC